MNPAPEAEASTETKPEGEAEVEVKPEGEAEAQPAEGSEKPEAEAKAGDSKDFKDRQLLKAIDYLSSAFAKAE